MDDLKKANAQLQIRQQTMEQQSDSLRAEISQLRSDKASAVLHAKTVEEASETREAGRIGLVAEQTEQLREVYVRVDWVSWQHLWIVIGTRRSADSSRKTR